MSKIVNENIETTKKNLDEDKSAKEFNQKVFDRVNSVFGSNIDIEDIYATRPKNIRVARKLFFNFDEYFNWPSLENDFVSDKGFCYGLDSHFAILSSGKVAPCCLDKDATVELGDINKNTIKEAISGAQSS